jgi:hypothetical protein
MVCLPALSAFYIGLGQIWSNIPYPAQIGATIMLVDTLLGALLGISSIQYAKQNIKEK